MKDPDLAKLLEARKHVALLRHPQVVTAASNNVLAERISIIDLPPIIDDFMLSEERQELLRSYKRPEIPEF